MEYVFWRVSHRPIRTFSSKKIEDYEYECAPEAADA